MITHITHSRFTELLDASDKKLLLTDLSKLKYLLSNASNSKEEGLWTDELLNYINCLKKAELIHLHWQTKLRNPEYSSQIEYFYLIGYARVINLLMQYCTDMGHSKDDFCFLKSLLENPCFNSAKSISGCGTGELIYELTQLGYENIEGISAVSGIFSPKGLNN